MEHSVAQGASSPALEYPAELSKWSVQAKGARTPTDNPSTIHNCCSSCSFATSALAFFLPTNFAARRFLELRVDSYRRILLAELSSLISTNYCSSFWTHCSALLLSSSVRLKRLAIPTSLLNYRAWSFTVSASVSLHLWLCGVQRQRQGAGTLGLRASMSQATEACLAVRWNGYKGRRRHNTKSTSSPFSKKIA